MSQVVFTPDGETLITPKQIAGLGGAPAQEFDAKREEQSFAQLALLLSLTAERLNGGENIGRAVDYLFRQLHLLRRGTSRGVWSRLAATAQGHAVAGLIHQDPFTRWSFEKPRGYSGDAGLLDFIYRHSSAQGYVDAASPLGRAVYDYTSEAPAAAAVRERREILARVVDEAAARVSGAEVLTIAGGHLREAELSGVLAGGGLSRWLVLDQDPQSVGTVMRDQRGTAVDARDGSVKGLLANRYTLGSFDLVYAAGLYDYLPRAASIKLTRTCLGMLKPGGRFLFANFATDVPDDGYMESFMNWPLLLRGEAEVRDIMEGANDGRFGTQLFFGANRNVIYGVMERLA